MTVMAFLSHILQVLRLVDCLRQGWAQKKCLEKKSMYSVPVIGQMNLKNCFNMQIILCLILRLSSFGLD